LYEKFSNFISMLYNHNFTSISFPGAENKCAGTHEVTYEETQMK
jgi:hypothetical protein